MQIATKINHNNIFPGMTTMGTEFYAAAENKLRVFHNESETVFEALPEYVYKTIRRVMGNKLASIEDMKAFAFGRWGGMDDKIDISEDGIPSEPEYIPDYTAAYFDNGLPIGEGPLRVLKLIGLKDQEIAEKLFLSRHTVAGHCAYLFHNIGTNSRTQIALWATKKGII